ncbi:MAG: trypsin-like peptidase domain-containing protein [Nannocystis sp.]|uniref:trypsin-like peptidase domain-containing protein n=1 Tax=Nannocystis sp. TaxID=1962667 RepID=UPI002421993C|nr:trypsin-like peptidase domain-containing protein [Nannocystis sp.]MBK9758231.1 trypsin-like peptidase domain-containing protein [Nannocystis sp.]
MTTTTERDPAGDPLHPQAEAQTWRASLQRVCAAVVSVRIDATRPFDTEWNGTSQATAFVVDAGLGIVLTNRHVVHPGPVVAEAVFLNHEEIPLRPLYRDPVHDFGFYQYDPSALRFMQPTALRLAPEKARVGTEIRVVGNDAGEKLSILAGTLARLDRPAPSYGVHRYNDFNTFYIQAASGTSGGSSGSPVVDIHGDVVGLNAGSRTQAASSFFLPLDRVVRALELVRAGLPVPRGTLMTTFAYTPYDELRRLGLRQTSEQAARAVDPEATGLLVVEKRIPGGVTDGLLEPGDILLRAEGRELADFVPLDELLDTHVGRPLDLDIERGGQPMRVRPVVHDLHAITPASFLELGGGVLHDLSYQRARNPQVPLRGAYLASAGYMFAPLELERAVILAIAGRPTPDLATATEILQSLPHGARATVRYYDLEAPTRERVAVITIDRRWFAMTHHTRDDATGLWPGTACPPPPPAPPPQPTTISFPHSDDPRIAGLLPSLVTVDAAIPYKIDGVHAIRFRGAGLVLDAARGLVVTDRNTVPVALVDLRITLAGGLEIPAEPVFLHPHHNYAIVRYDPALVGDTPVRSAELHPRPLTPGEPVRVVALKANHRVFCHNTEISAVEPVDLPLPRPPRFRAMNLERVTLATTIESIGGVLTDADSRVLALWSSFSYQDNKEHRTGEFGLPALLLRELLDDLRHGREPVCWDLGVELGLISLAEARNHGLSAAAAARLEAHDPVRRQVLSVTRTSVAAPGWRAGDLLLAVAAVPEDSSAADRPHVSSDSRPVNTFREVELAAAAGRLRVTVLRDGAEQQLDVRAVAHRGCGTDRVIHWAGALLQAPHHAAQIQRNLPPEGAYISLYWYGSPASRSRLRAARRIVAVDGRPTLDLDAFLAAVADKPNHASLRLKTVDLDDKVELITLRLDLDYFPTYELRRTADGWVRRAL